ncbi:TraE/TraK family type IV conjugative transfer system protein [Persephonella sp.]
MKKYYNFWEKIITENRIYQTVIVVLAGVIIAEGVLINSLFKEKQVVILPPKIEKEFWVAGDKLSTSYLEQVAYYIADRVLSVSPLNVDHSFDAILPFLTTDPETIKDIQTSLALQAKKIKDNDIYQVFYPMKFWVDDKRYKMYVEGMLKKMTANTYLGQERVVLELRFTVKNGRLLVTSIEIK